MPSKYPISRAEFKKRVRLVYETWPAELLLARIKHSPDTQENAGCIMQVALETDSFGSFSMEGLVDGVTGSDLALIAMQHDAKQYAKALAAVEAL